MVMVKLNLVNSLTVIKKYMRIWMWNRSLNKPRTSLIWLTLTKMVV